MAANIKRLEQKVEEQQEKIYAYELEVQKIPELIKGSEENRKLLAKIAEVEKDWAMKIQ